MRKRFDSSIQSSIELERWDVIRKKLKGDKEGLEQDDVSLLFSLFIRVCFSLVVFISFHFSLIISVLSPRLTHIQ